MYFDNYFTSLNLLEKDGIYACGTTRSDRVGFPVDLKDPSLPDRYINDNSITLAYLFQRRLFDEDNKCNVHGLCEERRSLYHALSATIG